jgi:hypothetical protein
MVKFGEDTKLWLSSGTPWSLNDIARSPSTGIDLPQFDQITIFLTLVRDWRAWDDLMSSKLINQRWHIVSCHVRALTWYKSRQLNVLLGQSSQTIRVEHRDLSLTYDRTMTELDGVRLRLRFLFDTHHSSICLSRPRLESMNDTFAP